MKEKIDLDLFKTRLEKYSEYYYETDFDNFWNWKTEIENDNGHIFDDSTQDITFRKISNILPSWQVYRPLNPQECLAVLKYSIPQMSMAYSEIKNYTLLEFSEIPREPLEAIWHCLGRCKEHNGEINPNGYSAVAITKPLKFFWGQTLAFDKLVRKSIPRFSNVTGVYGNRWDFERWIQVMKNFQSILKNQPEIIDYSIEFSEDKYGSNSQIPYGHFLDVYYWIEGKELFA